MKPVVTRIFGILAAIPLVIVGALIAPVIAVMRR